MEFCAGPLIFSHDLVGLFHSAKDLYNKFHGDEFLPFLLINLKFDFIVFSEMKVLFPPLCTRNI